ncbi:MAG: efflux RND transporter periplasmic adaptor subunit [Roseiflexaceae bacterium]
MSEPGRTGALLRPRTLLTAAGLLLAVGACALGVFALRDQGSAPPRAYSLIYPRYDTLTATVNATGQIEPAQVVNLSFSSPGRVGEVLVKVGDVVAQGAPLARLDARDLHIRVVQAEAQLAQAQASYQKQLDGASTAEVAAAEAQLAQARGQLRQTQGSVSAADLRAAEAQLVQAQAQLQQLSAGPKASDLQVAEAQLAQAQAQLAGQRDQLSVAKTNTQLQMQQATEALTQAQSRYSTAKQHWDYVQATGRDPINTTVDPQTGRRTQTKLSDAQRQQYYDAFVQAEAAMHSAEAAVQQALVAYDAARQAEVNGIQLAEGQVAAAQASLDKLHAGADADQFAAARAQLAAAQANLDKLRGEQRRGTLDSAQGGVDQAEANLERLKAGPRPSDLAIAQAQVASAQAALDLVRLNLDQATLTAPFAGTVAEVNLKPGETPSVAEPPVVLADLSSFHVDVAVDEIDVSRLAVGQPVTLTLDALPGLALPGVVESIDPLATARSAVTSYEVRVRATSSDQRVRSGMSTNADIVVARKPNVLLAPRRAVRSDRGRLVVDLPRDQTLCEHPPEQRPPAPELSQREVTTGLSNEQVIEIVAGLDEGACVYVEGIDARLRFFESRGPPGGRDRN